MEASITAGISISPVEFPAFTLPFGGGGGGSLKMFELGRVPQTRTG